jgi:hypothetical protein
MTREDIWLIVKRRLKLSDDSLKEIALEYIEEIENRILHYCNITEVPVGLKFTWVSMTMDVLRVELPSEDAIAETADSGTNVKIGDTSVNQAGGKAITNMSKSSIDDVVLNYKIDLNRYRKLKW